MEEKQEIAIQDIYPDDFSWCYGCGRLNEKGHRFRTGWEGDKTVTVYEPLAEHTAIPGVVYGGLVASLIDCHGTGSAALALHKKNGHVPGDGAEPPRFVTGSLKVDFVKPTPQDVPLKAVGIVDEIHPKKFKVLVEVFADNDVTARGEVIAVSMPSHFMKK